MREFFEDLIENLIGLIIGLFIFVVLSWIIYAAATTSIWALFLVIFIIVSVIGWFWLWTR
jgi:fucose permease